MADRARRVPSASTTSAVSRKPAVSTKRKRRPASSASAWTASRVVPAVGDTMARSWPTSALSSVDLPAFGRPPRTTVTPSRASAPSRAVLRKSVSSRSASASRSASWSRSAKATSSSPKSSSSSTSAAVSTSDWRTRSTASETEPRSAEVAARRPSVLWAWDQVGDGLGLGQVQLAVEEGARRELAGRRRLGAGVVEHAEDGLGDGVAAVAGDLDHVLARRGVRPAPDHTDHLVDWRAAFVSQPADPDRPPLSLRQSAIGKATGDDSDGVGSAHAHDRQRRRAPGGRERGDGRGVAPDWRPVSGGMGRERRRVVASLIGGEITHHGSRIQCPASRIRARSSGSAQQLHPTFSAWTRRGRWSRPRPWSACPDGSGGASCLCS